MEFAAPDARILAVDDSDINLEILAEMLSQTGAKVDLAAGGAEALELVRKSGYDLIFIDHRMPGMDGIETLKKIRDSGGGNSKIPCVALTGDTYAGAAEFFKKSGFDSYLSKPVEIGPLLETLKERLPEEKIVRSVESSDFDVSTLLNDRVSTLLNDRVSILPDNLDGIDFESALKNCGNQKILFSAAKKFCGGAQKTAEELENLLESGKIGLYNIKVHALKSTARLVGATELSKMAEELENLSEGGKTDGILEKNRILVSKLLEIEKKLSPIFTSCNIIEKPALSDEEFSARLEKIRAFSLDFDLDGLDAQISEIGSFALGEKAASVFREIRERVENVDFKGLLEIVG